MLSTVKTYGEYQSGDSKFSVLCEEDSKGIVVVLATNNTIYSAFKKDHTGSFSFNNTQAKEAYEFITKGNAFCNSKNVAPTPFEKGVANRYEFSRYNVNYAIEKFDGKLCGCEVSSKDKFISLKYNENVNIPADKIPWVALTVIKEPKKVEAEFKSEFREASEDELYDIPVRSLDEIRLEKDLTWLEKKNYYVVNNDKTAEELISKIENYSDTCKGLVVFDTETSGLFINMFGKIGSKKKQQLEELNKQLKAEGKQPYRVDSLTGAIFCVQANVSYYFPVGHRKFRNLYELDENGKFSETAQRVVNKIKADYTIGKYSTRKDSMAIFIRSTAPEDWGSDVIYMERVRHILETGHIGAHNGVYDWKVCWLYNICMNLKEDSLVMHKLMYKFRSTTENRGEPSDLKSLSGKELPEQNINQLSLSDFFVGYKESDDMTIQTKSATSKKKKKNKGKDSKIDFSYMTLEGTKAYAPADGDLTFQIIVKYKNDMKINHLNLEYLYNVELIVSCAIAYMEFYGLRIDEDKIESVKHDTQAEKIVLEHAIRKILKYNSIEEDELTQKVEKLNSSLSELQKAIKKIGNSSSDAGRKAQLQGTYDKQYIERDEAVDRLRACIDSSEKVINLSSPIQMAKVIYDNPEMDSADAGQGIGKKVLKKYLDMKNEKGEPKYPLIVTYSKWKNLDTLLSKFFDNLPDYMYPGGYIFASYGQISTATGRMSCSKPNNQQYPKSITAIVIPREDCVMIDADFSQIEYRTLVALADEKGLKEKFGDPDNDYHTMMASLMFGVPYALVNAKMRSDAKSFNFGIPYGMGFDSLAILIRGVANATTVEEAKEKYELYFKEQPLVREFFNRTKEKARINQYTETKWHRRRSYSFTNKDGVFDKRKMGAALRQAGNAVIQGTAADIFKIAVARTFMYIKENNLFEKFYITNLVHDEQLTECNVKELDPQVTLKGLIDCMELNIDGFPPLFVGAGVGLSWKDAKGKMAEIHPHLATKLMDEVKDQSIIAKEKKEPVDVIKYFDDRVFDFRVNKIRDYCTNEDNWGKALHPAIGNLLDLQFDFGVTEEFNRTYTEDKYSKDEIAAARVGITAEQLKRFLAEYNLDIDPNKFSTDNIDIEEEIDTDEYDEVDEEDVESGEYERLDTEFALIDESNLTYGIDLRDIIRQFGLCIDEMKGICGIDVSVMNYKRKDEMAEYMEKHACDPKDPEALQVVFLKDNNILFETGVYVKGISGSRMSTILNISGLIV